MAPSGRRTAGTVPLAIVALLAVAIGMAALERGGLDTADDPPAPRRAGARGR